MQGTIFTADRWYSSPSLIKNRSGKGCRSLIIMPDHLLSAHTFFAGSHLKPGWEDISECIDKESNPVETQTEVMESAAGINLIPSIGSVSELQEHTSQNIRESVALKVERFVISDERWRKNKYFSEKPEGERSNIYTF